MIKNIIYVEDGSVDIDELKEGLNEETKVIVYRQGSTPPKLIQPEKPIGRESVSPENIVKRTLLQVRMILTALIDDLRRTAEERSSLTDAKLLIEHRTEAIIENVLE